MLTEATSPLDIVMRYYGNSTHNGSHIPFNFLFINRIQNGSNANDYKNVVNDWMNKMPEGRTANWVVSYFIKD